ncbi:hypothetical protein IG9_05739 [Bacillus cereus HuA2-9]|uniref:Uncharacterized protein n=1 Tax=Bacillus cereus HuA4-10 TaxID=1053206 RepID=J8D5H9_BACCE|nr:hypothetical protein IGC_05633 [Bacillus cereus HuA4-10]EOO11891.1 hypothetical protein IG9_05739 [Bacillus cereus HuA2-9]
MRRSFNRDIELTQTVQFQIMIHFQTKYVQADFIFGRVAIPDYERNIQKNLSALERL